MSETAKKIRCEIDGVEVRHLGAHLAEQHHLSLAEYRKLHPNASSQVCSSDVLERHAAIVKNLRRESVPPPEALTVKIGPFKLPVNWDVPEEACLPLPPHYLLPTHGRLGEDIARALRYWIAGRSTWIWGSTGSGKDALTSAVCAMTRTPSAIFPVNPDVDILAWFYDKSFDAEGTRWEFGELFHALVHGFESPITGRQIPMTIILSDFDRAGRSQAEAIRLVADSIQGRVKGPRGETYPVLPGTRLVITANTMGGGDATGRCVSANVLDSSIINRIERKVMFHQMDWQDEERIIRAKFPVFADKHSNMFTAIGQAVTVLRRAVESASLYGEFSHRDLCTWIGDCEDLLRYSDAAPHDLLRQGFLSYVDGLPDEDTRTQALTLIDPHLKGGALPRGNVGTPKDGKLRI